MKRSILILIAAINLSNLFGQGFSKVYELDNPVRFMDLILEDEAETHLSGDGSYFIINSPEQFDVIGGEKGSEIISGKHLEKSGGVQLASNLLSGMTPGFMADGEALKESTGFFVFEADNVVVFLDWTLDQNIIRAFDVETGEKLWETSKYRYTPDKDDQMASVLATLAVNKTLRNNVPTSGVTQSGVYYQVDLQAGGNYGSKDASAFITPLKSTGSFLMKVGDKHVCLDVRTGKEKWVYDDYPISIAEHIVTENQNSVVLVNFNPSYFGKSENIILKLDLETGEELLRISHLNNYVEDRTYVVNNRLVLDYYGVEMFDLNSGERLLLTIDEKIISGRNTMMNLLGGNDDANNEGFKGHPSFVVDGVLYTGTSRVGRQIHPLKPGSRNNTLYAYDLETGDEKWSSDIEHRSQLVDVHDNQLILKYQKGLKKHVFYAMDRQNGEKIGETDKIKQYLLRDGGGYLITDNSILISGKRGIHVYNLDSWEKTGELDIKEADVGKIQAMDVTPDGLFMVADKGIGFYNHAGRILESIEIRKVESSVWYDDKLILFTKDNVEAVNLTSRTVAGKMPKTTSMLFSENLENWLTGEDHYLAKYTLEY